MYRVLCLPLLATACTVGVVAPIEAEIVCAAGGDCPDGRICVSELGRCMSPDDPCLDGASPADGNACDLDDATGFCEAGICRPHVCGDDEIGPGEQCDDGARNSDAAPDACRTDCRLATCGDGTRDTGEECDGGTANSDTLADACRASCLAPSCGDGVIDTGEECDDGFANSDTLADACRTSCELPTCGDRVVDAEEECDDGNEIDRDNCTNACELAECGDGVIWNAESGTELCDDHNTVTESCPYGETACAVCASDCSFAAGVTSFCGDGRVRDGEECDGTATGCTGCQIDAGFYCEGEPSRCAVGLFVDASAVGGGDGSSWAEAFDLLQDALTAAAALDTPAELWVAAGEYFPDRGADQTSGDRESSFELRSGIALFGGFAGVETARAERDPESNTTILNGDLAGDDGPAYANRADNSYHVVFAFNTDDTAILDGFRIRGGEADTGLDELRGGGMFIQAAAPVVRNCELTGNRAGGGAAVFSKAASPRFERCRIVDNESTSLGGGMRIIGGDPVLVRTTFAGNSANFGGGLRITYGSRPVFVGCGFYGNSATSVGGAMDVDDSLPIVVNSVFSANTASNGGAMYNTDSSPLVINSTFVGNVGTWVFRTLDSDGPESRPVLINTVFWDATDNEIRGTAEVSYSCVRGAAHPGPGNIAGCTPTFTDPDGADDIAGTPDDDLSLADGSPGLDAGNNEALPLDATDLDNDGDLTEPIPLDFLDGTRRQDNSATDTGVGTAPIVDMGAYESP